MKTVLLRLSGFTLLPILLLVTPLLLLPVISSFVGAGGISSVLAGQAIGVFAGTVIMWGWNVDGPVAIARTINHKERSAIYLSSIRTRLSLLLLTLPAAAAITAITVLPEFRSEAISMALASALVGMSPAWFCIGLGQPKLLALFDTVPRFSATVLAIPILMVTQELWIYAVLMAVATGLSLILFHLKFSPGGNWSPRDFRRTLAELKSQAHTAGINVAGNSYQSTPVPIATATTAPAASGPLATADTLYRVGLFSVVALGNALQAWVLESGAKNTRTRQLVGIGSHAVLGVIGAVILTLFGPAASSIVFAGQVRADTLICLYYGIAFVFISAATPLIRNLLIPSGKGRLVLKLTIISAVTGVAGMLAFGMAGNAAGIALSMAGSEFLLFIALLGPALGILKNQVNSGATETKTHAKP